MHKRTQDTREEVKMTLFYKNTFTHTRKANCKTEPIPNRNREYQPNHRGIDY